MKDEAGFVRKPYEVRPHPSTPKRGTQRLYFFPNGYGASVVRFPGSQGWESRKWELCVLRGGPEDFDHDMTTPVADRVCGWLKPEKVEELLTQIENLPAVDEESEREDHEGYGGAPGSWPRFSPV